MPYEEPEIIDENGEIQYHPGQEYMQNPLNISPYVNPENVFLKHLTEVQYPENIDDEFKNKWVHRLMFSGKEKSTAFMESHKTTGLDISQMVNISMMESFDEWYKNLIWSEVFDNINIMKLTQGQHGNLIHAITTKRQEFTDKTQIKPVGWKERMGKIMQGNQQQEEQPRF